MLYKIYFNNIFMEYLWRIYSRSENKNKNWYIEMSIEA